MGRMEEWAESLRYESLRQAADTFFGARKAVERERAILSDWVAKVRDVSQKIESWTAALNCLLGSAATSRMFFSRLGICLPEERLYATHACHLHFARPRSFTRRGLYCKILWSVYEHWADALHEYHHGRPYHDPTLPGRTLHTPSYRQVMEFCAELNARIRHTNSTYRPSESLDFARRLDPEAQDKSSLLGCGAELCSLDDTLALPEIDFASLGLLEWPEPPEPKIARRVVNEFCQTLYQRQRERIEPVLSAALQGEDKGVCTIHGVDGTMERTASS